MDQTQLKAEILERASGQFIRFGYGKTTTDEIASAVGISKKTLYRLFRSKQELFHSVALMHLHDVKDKFDCLTRDRNKSVIDKLRESMRIMVAKLQEVGNFLKERTGVPGWMYDEIMTKRRDIIVGFFRRLFREGMKKGAINRRVNETAFVLILVTVSQSLFTPEMLSGLPITHIELFSGVAHTLLEGVLSDRERKKLQDKPPVMDMKGKRYWHG